MNKDRMTGNIEWYQHLFAQFEKNLNGQTRQRVHQLRKQAIGHLTKSGFPTVRDEEWKYTDLSPLTGINFAFTDSCKISHSDIKPFLIKNLSAYNLVFVNGHFIREWSDTVEPESDFQLLSLDEYLAQNNGNPDELLASYASSDIDIFTAMNNAFLGEGVILRVPENVKVKKPVHIIYINEGQNKTITTPRNLIITGQGAEVKVIETYAGLGENEYFTNAVDEIFVAQNAKVEHFRIQVENKAAFHIGSVYVHQERDSNYISHNFSFGGKLVRNNISSYLGGENIECALNGLYIGNEKQHIDNHTTIDHAMPHCHSDELYKGILDNKAKGVFNGKIFVRQDAQKTNAIQNNNAILLSDDATIDTKPQLEIFADDVRCTHGATIGQLDEDAYFYLRTRGIDKVRARQLLIFAFAGDVIDRVELEPVREVLAQRLADKLHTIRPE